MTLGNALQIIEAEDLFCLGSDLNQGDSAI